MQKSTILHVLNVLRYGTVTWNGRSDCLNRFRRRKFVGHYKNGKVKEVWEYQCQSCWNWFNKVDLEVDHIKEVGAFDYAAKGDDLVIALGKYATAMYCDQDNLQALCVECHQEKTSNFNSTLKHVRKNSLDDNDFGV